MHIHCFRFFPRTVYHKILSIVPCVVYSRSLLVVYFIYRSVELSLKHNFYQSHFSVAKISMTIPPDFLSAFGFMSLVFTDFVTRAAGLLPVACSEPAGGPGHEDQVRAGPQTSISTCQWGPVTRSQLRKQRSRGSQRRRSCGHAHPHLPGLHVETTHAFEPG